MKLLCLLSFIFVSHVCSWGQKNVAHIRKNKTVNANGKTTIYIKKNGTVYITNINNYNTKETEYILNANKYLDIHKLLLFNFGGNTSDGMINGDADIYPFLLNNPDDDNDQKKILKFSIKERKLKISSEIYGFDDSLICKIVDNKLITLQDGVTVHTSDNYFEVIDDYNIPVLQIELNKNDNSIKLGGAFNFARSFYVIGKDGIYPSMFFKDKKKMSKAEKDKHLDYFLNLATEHLKPLHE